jgi:hypothetical protein
MKAAFQSNSPAESFSVFPDMAKKFPLHPKHPERLCWGCDKYCPADSLACGNGSERTQHPVELFGDDWHEWGGDQADDKGTADK